MPDLPATRAPPVGMRAEREKAEREAGTGDSVLRRNTTFGVYHTACKYIVHKLHRFFNSKHARKKT